MTETLHDPVHPSYSRLIRYAATQACSDAKQWEDAHEALAACENLEDASQAWRELDQRRANCDCTPCAARRAVETAKAHKRQKGAGR